MPSAADHFHHSSDIGLDRSQKIDWVLDRRQPSLAIVLENVFDPHNIAAVMRTCDAVGVQEVFVITNQLPRKRHWGHKSSRGAVRWVDLRQFDDVDACMAEVRSRYGRVLGAYISQEALPLWSIEMISPLALVFGNEKYGISDGMLKHCDGAFMIPQQGMVVSLNISVACAVTLYEAMRQRMTAGLYANPQMIADAREKLRGRWVLQRGRN